MITTCTFKANADFFVFQTATKTLEKESTQVGGGGGK